VVWVLKIDGSARGCVKRMWINWKSVSTSLGDALPDMPSSSSPMNGDADAIFPVSTRRRSALLNLPRPPAVTAAVALLAGTKSASLASEVPPGLTARNRISSCRKVVGLNTTFAPFESSHSVMPSASFFVSLVTDAGAGSVSIRTADATRSTYAVSSLPGAFLKTAASAASSGTVTPAFSGALTITRRLVSGYHSFAMRLISSSVISGTKRATSAYSSSIDGSVSPLRKLRTYSLALDAAWTLSFSASARSRPRRIVCFCRSSSVAVKPNCATRCASASTASSPRSTPPSFTSAPSDALSFVRPMKGPRPAKAEMYGASGFCASSPSRTDSIEPNSRSTSRWR
jgi:hypothetical protein